MSSDWTVLSLRFKFVNHVASHTYSEFALTAAFDDSGPSSRAAVCAEGAQSSY